MVVLEKHNIIIYVDENFKSLLVMTYPNISVLPILLAAFGSCMACKQSHRRSHGVLNSGA